MNALTPSFDAFVEFCSEQTPEQIIIHDSYDTCAVGDYTVSVGMGRIDAFKVVCKMVDGIKIVCPKIAHKFWLGVGNASSYPEYQTYGGFTYWLKQVQHQIHEVSQ